MQPGGGALSVTGDSMQRSNDMAAQIAGACEQQSRVTEEIARNTSDIRDLSKKALQAPQHPAAVRAVAWAGPVGGPFPCLSD